MIPCIGNIVNTAAVLIGGVVGLLLKKGISQKLQETLIKALGMCTVFIGISGVLSAVFTVKDGKLEAEGIMLLIFSMVIGTVAGELIGIETWLDRLGERLKRLSGGDDASSFTKGFVNGSLIICVGAMAIVGSISDGLGDPSTLFAKSALDCVIIMIFASTMGIGAMFSALPMFLYQGIFNVIGILCGNIMSATLLQNLSMVGNVLIFGVGINLMFGNRIRVGNMLPALLVPVAWELIGHIL